MCIWQSDIVQKEITAVVHQWKEFAMVIYYFQCLKTLSHTHLVNEEKKKKVNQKKKKREKKKIG